MKHGMIILQCTKYSTSEMSKFGLKHKKTVFNWLMSNDIEIQLKALHTAVIREENNQISEIRRIAKISTEGQEEIQRQNGVQDLDMRKRTSKTCIAISSSLSSCDYYCTWNLSRNFAELLVGGDWRRVSQLPIFLA